ncbi:hypothetical protein G3N93_09420 [Burkholderia sp. Se-20378]|nr:hypothetical protein [Burkholderia sp. Se-20378]
MKNAPIIDLSLRAPRDMIAERGRLVGSAMIIWFRLLRPALVGAVWASICIYTYRYLLPFNPAEMPIEQMVFYATSIAIIAGTIVTWLIATTHNKAAPALYIVAMSVVSLVALLGFRRMPSE